MNQKIFRKVKLIFIQCARINFSYSVCWYTFCSWAKFKYKYNNVVQRQIFFFWLVFYYWVANLIIFSFVLLKGFADLFSVELGILEGI